LNQRVRAKTCDAAERQEEDSRNTARIVNERAGFKYLQTCSLQRSTQLCCGRRISERERTVSHVAEPAERPKQRVSWIVHGDQQPPAGAEQPGEFGDGCLEIPPFSEMIERRIGNDRVERLRSQWNMPHVAGKEMRATEL